MRNKRLQSVELTSVKTSVVGEETEHQIEDFGLILHDDDFGDFNSIENMSFILNMDTIFAA